MDAYTRTGVTVPHCVKWLAIVGHKSFYIIHFTVNTAFFANEKLFQKLTQFDWMKLSGNRMKKEMNF